MNAEALEQCFALLRHVLDAVAGCATPLGLPWRDFTSSDFQLRGGGDHRRPVELPPYVEGRRYGSVVLPPSHPVTRQGPQDHRDRRTAASPL